MNDILKWGLVILAVIGPLFGITMVLRYLARRNWRVAAEAMGLRLEPGNFFGVSVLKGAYQGYEIEVAPDTSILAYSRVYTNYKVAAPQVLPEGVYVGRGHKPFAGEKLEVQVPLLDDTFTIRAKQPHLARQFLRQPNVEGPLLELLTAQPYLYIHDGAVHVFPRGIARPYEIEMVLDDIVVFLNTLTPISSHIRSSTNCRRR